MPKSSIVIFADGPHQYRYRDLGVDKESLHIFACTDAAGILDRLRANVVLIDSGTTAKKGIRLLKEVKARHPQIPVVFITDMSSEELAIAAFRAGAREYFANPVNRLVLKKTIRRLVEARKNFAETRKPYGSFLDAEPEVTSDFDEKNMPPRLREVIVYIEEYLMDKITLSSLAEGMRMSKFHFSRYFREYVGKSPMKYVNFVRIKRAKILLEREDLTITEIAHQVGYSDLNALLRNFKKETGRTPTEVRKRRGRDHCGMM